jgi:hypothetical protein
MAETYVKYGPSSQARENLAIALATDEDDFMAGEEWEMWADTDTGKGTWRRKADALVARLVEAGYTVSDDSEPVA